MALMFTMVGDSDEQSIIVFVPGEKPLVARSDHPNFKAIAKGAMEQDESIADLFDVAATVAQKFERLSERITTAGGKLYLDGDPMSGVIVDHILRSMQEGLNDFQPLVNFIELLASNPNQGSVEQLYAWLQREDFTIDTDGFIVGYKGVEPSPDGGYQSIRTGKAIVNGELKSGSIPNNLGDIVEMPRSEVQFDPGVGCSTGLHVGNFDYASGWARGAVLEVRVDPRDVVSVPTDCEAQKMRVCRYTVVDVVEQKFSAPVVGSSYDDVPDYDDYDVWGDGEYEDDYSDPIW